MDVTIRFLGCVTIEEVGLGGIGSLFVWLSGFSVGIVLAIYMFDR